MKGTKEDERERKYTTVDMRQDERPNARKETAMIEKVLVRGRGQDRRKEGKGEEKRRKETSIPVIWLAASLSHPLLLADGQVLLHSSSLERRISPDSFVSPPPTTPTFFPGEAHLEHVARLSLAPAQQDHQLELLESVGLCEDQVEAEEVDGVS